VKSIGKAIAESKDSKKDKNNSTEHQVFGSRMAEELEDKKHIALYIKMAKEESRKLITDALSYTKDYPKVKSKAKLFMWRFKLLKEAKKS
jgi:hypothetical protein